jgi:hypothetical protein
MRMREVVVLSALPMDVLLKAQKSLDACVVLQKPITPVDLAAELERCIPVRAAIEQFSHRCNCPAVMSPSLFSKAKSQDDSERVRTMFDGCQHRPIGINPAMNRLIHEDTNLAMKISFLIRANTSRIASLGPSITCANCPPSNTSNPVTPTDSLKRCAP